MRTLIRLAPALALGALDLPAFALPAQQPRAAEPLQLFELERVVGTGDLAPDSNGPFAVALFPPVISDTGLVAVSARYFGSKAGEDDNEALLVIDDGVAEVRIREGDPVPDGNGSFGSVFPEHQPVFYWPAIGAGGEVACHASIISLSFGDSGVMLTEPGGTVVQMVRAGQTLPGGFRLDEISAGSVPLTRSGETAMLLRTTELATSTPGQGVWRFSATTAEKILGTSDASPDGDGAVANFHWGWVSLSEAGDAAFVTTLDDGAQADGALLYGDELNLDVLAREGETALPNLVYHAMDEYAGQVIPVINARGQVATLLFRAKRRRERAPRNPGPRRGSPADPGWPARPGDPPPALAAAGSPGPGLPPGPARHALPRQVLVPRRVRGVPRRVRHRPGDAHRPDRDPEQRARPHQSAQSPPRRRLPRPRDRTGRAPVPRARRRVRRPEAARARAAGDSPPAARVYRLTPRGCAARCHRHCWA